MTDPLTQRSLLLRAQCRNGSKQTLHQCSAAIKGHETVPRDLSQSLTRRTSTDSLRRHVLAALDLQKLSL